MALHSSLSNALNKDQQKVLDSIFKDSKNSGLSQTSRNQPFLFTNSFFTVWFEYKVIKCCFVFVCLSFCVSMFYLFNSSLSLGNQSSVDFVQKQIEKINLDLKVKVLREGGQPVAGARLAVDGESFGVTDSFGEWERRVYIEKSKDLVIKVSKPGSMKGKNKVITKTIQSKDLEPFFNKPISSTFTTAIEIHP